MTPPYEISVVSTLYRSRPFLEEFLNRTVQILNEIGFKNYEFVFVNDGSPDDSLEFLVKKKTEYPFLKIINLSRNFGHHNAILAGLSFSKGNLVFLIDCDLEVDPAILIQLHEKALEQQADVVYGYQVTRKGGFVEKNFGGIFWKLINYLSDTTVPENLLTERIMTRPYVQSLINLGDRNLFLGGMMAWTGFKQIGIPYVKKKREGVSTYTFFKRFDLLINAISSFTSKPLLTMFYFGIFITFLSGAFGIFFIIKKIVSPNLILTGFTSLITVIFFSTGILTSCLGIIGIYIAKIFKQVQNRPNYIIKEIL